LGPGRLSRELSRLRDAVLVQALALEKSLGLVRLQWCGTNICQTNPGACTDARSINGHLRRHANDGEVSDLAFQFDVRSATASGGSRDTDLCQNFIRTERGGEEIGKELGDWNGALALEASSHDLSFQGEEGRRVIVGRVSMGQVPRDGGQVRAQPARKYT